MERFDHAMLQPMATLANAEAWRREMIMADGGGTVAGRGR
jgi:hypothetical protein